MKKFFSDKFNYQDLGNSHIYVVTKHNKNSTEIWKITINDWYKSYFFKVNEKYYQSIDFIRGRSKFHCCTNLIAVCNIGNEWHFT